MTPSLSTRQQILQTGRRVTEFACFWLITLTMLSSFCHAGTLSTDSHFSFEYLNDYTEYLEDPDHRLDVYQAKQAKWQQLTGIFNEGFSDSQYWFRFSVANQSGSTQHYMLEMRHPFIDYYDIYYEFRGEIIKREALGDQTPVNQRNVKHSDFLSSFSLQNNERITVYIRVASESTLQLPLKLWYTDVYTEHNHRTSVFLGFLLGFLIGISAYHITIYFSTWEQSYLYYAFLNLSLTTTLSCLNGVPGFFIWPSLTSSADTILLLGLHGGAIFGCFFTREICDGSERVPKLTMALNACAVLCLLCLAMMPIVSYITSLKLSFLCSTIAMILCITTFAKVTLQGYQPVYIALAACIVACTGIFITLLDKLNLLPNNALASNAIYLGLIMMSLMQAFALSFRFKVERDAHEESQQDLIVAQKKLNYELDTVVKQRTEELEIANERLLELSTTDSLTGLHNRRYFDENAVKEYKNAFRNKLPVGIILLDIDHFKSVNDNYGHPFGDLCLKDVAHIVSSSIRRPPDIGARYGGEEYIILLPNTDGTGVKHVAETIRQKVKAHRFSDEKTSITLTISLGALSEVPTQSSTLTQLVSQADQLLYRAKEEGRDRVCTNL